MANRRFFDAVVQPRPRLTSCRVSTFVLLLVFGRCAAAQIDTDPSNDSQASADALLVPAGTAFTNTAALAAPDNDVDFFTVELTMGDTLLGMTTPIASLPGDFDVPDTMASVLSGGVPLTFSDDDGSNETPDTGMGR